MGPPSTIIEISNDATATVHIECEYINERKGRVNFDYDLTAKQTASWDVFTREGDQVSPRPIRRAVLSLKPARAAAIACGAPSLRSSMYRLT